MRVASEGYCPCTDRCHVLRGSLRGLLCTSRQEAVRQQGHQLQAHLLRRLCHRTHACKDNRGSSEKGGHRCKLTRGGTGMHGRKMRS